HAIETVAFGTVVLIVVYFVSFERDFSGIVPMLGMYAFAGYRLMPALQQIFQAVTAVGFYSAALENVLDDLDSSADVHAHSASPPARRLASPLRRDAGVEPMGLRRKLQLKGVRFSYPELDPVWWTQETGIREMSIKEVQACRERIDHTHLSFVPRPFVSCV